MNWMLLGGIAVAALLLVLFRTMSGQRGKSLRPGYQKRDFLFTPEERLFLAALRDAVGEDYDIFGKVRIEAVLTPRPGSGRANAREDEFEAIAAQHFPFLLCRKADLAIACAVQLLDHSLAGTSSRESEDLLRPACQAAGLPLVGFEAGPLYDPHEIREAIAAAVRKEPLYVTEAGGRKEPRFSGLDNLKL